VGVSGVRKAAARGEEAPSPRGSFGPGAAPLRRSLPPLPLAFLGGMVRADEHPGREAGGHVALLAIRPGDAGGDRRARHRARPQPLRQPLGQTGQAGAAVRQALHVHAFGFARPFSPALAALGGAARGGKVLEVAAAAGARRGRGGPVSLPLRYTVFPERPESHLYRVTCTVAQPDPSGQAFALPAWIPGSYLVRDFARHVVSVRAESRGKPVAIEKTDKNTWRVQACAGPLTVTCDVYARDLSVRGAYLDPRHAFFNGACLFLKPKDLESSACELEIVRPHGAAYRRWAVATAMERAGAK